MRERVPTLMRLGSMKESIAPALIRDETRVFLESIAISAPLRTLLEAHSFNRSIMIGQHCFNAVNKLVAENGGVNERCLLDGLLVVGSGPNGDPVVVDLNDGAVGFVNHDEVWGCDEAQVRREAYVPTPFDLGTFYFAAALFAYNPDDPEAKVHTFPVDSYAAQEEGVTGWDDFKEGVRAFERSARRGSDV